MTEIPDEIREAGVAWVAEQTKHYSTESNLKTMACHDLMAGWIACYKFLTSGKPDGYVPMFWSLDGSKGGHSYIPSAGEFYLAVSQSKKEGATTPVRLLKCGGE